MDRYIIPISIMVAGVMVSAAVYFGMQNDESVPSQQASTTTTPQDDQGDQEIDAEISTEGWPSMGDPGAPVTMVEYSDFACSFCGRFFSETMGQIKEEYIDTGKVRFVYKDFAVIGGDRAAEAAHCAHEQDAFWEYHDLLFERQAHDRNLWSSSDTHREYARQLGLDQDALVSCFEERKYQSKVAESIQEAQSNGGRGTPYFIINGRPVSGAQPYSAFSSIIELALEEA